METYYDILGVTSSSSSEELKVAYHELALKYHPDKTADSRPDNRFSKIDEAWKTLRDPESRRLYDAALQQSRMEDQSLLYGSFKLADLKYEPHNEHYSCDCRCGGTYTFTKKDFEEFHSFLVGCGECSLMIIVDLQA